MRHWGPWSWWPWGFLSPVALETVIEKSTRPQRPNKQFQVTVSWKLWLKRLAGGKAEQKERRAEEEDEDEEEERKRKDADRKRNKLKKQEITWRMKNIVNIIRIKMKSGKKM
jgi:hypothetical protein